MGHVDETIKLEIFKSYLDNTFGLETLMTHFDEIFR